MRVNKRREAISQSMDLFIIIAAVLGVGGIVSASIFNLVSSATSDSSIMVIGASIVAGTGSTEAPSAISITLKNNGASTITCSSSNCEVVFSGTSIGLTPGTQCTSCIVSSPVGWGSSTTAEAPLTFTFSPSSTGFAPGAQTSFLVSGPVFTGTTLTGMPTHGSSVTLNVVFGTSSAQLTVVAQ